MDIKIEKAYKVYGDKRVLDIENLNFKEGLIYAVLGLNGSGKTTLLNCVSGIETFTEGEVFYNEGKDINNIRKQISIMFQKSYLFNTSVLRNLEAGLRFRKLNKEEINTRIDGFMKYFDMAAMLDKNAKKLSGGEQAKVALLRTAILETEVTFLDEPTASMDIESTFIAEKLIKDMATGNRTVVLVTHDLYQAERVADYIIFLEKGRIIEAGETFDFFNTPKHALVKQILRRGGNNDKNSNFNYE